MATTTTETAHGLAYSVARAMESREPAPFRSAAPIAFSTARGGYWGLFWLQRWGLPVSLAAQTIFPVKVAHLLGCLHSVEWNGGME